MPDKENKDKRKWYILDGRSISLLLVLLIAILFYVALTHFDVIQTRLSLFMGEVSPFIAGFAIAYLLNTPMCFFERKVYRKLRFKRGLSILTVYLLALALVVILLQMILPQVVQSIMDLATNMQYYLNGLERLVQQVTEQFQLEGAGIEESLEFIKNLTSKLTETVASSLPQLLDFGMAVGSGIISGITAVISSIYMLAGKGRLVPQLKKMLYAVVPKRRADKFLQICSHANKVFVGFINGKLIDSAIIGVLCFLLCLILRIPYPMLISVVIGVTNIIPFFGPILGAIPCLMILVIVDPWAALRFLVLVIALQQFDGNILGPKILGDSTGLSAIWVLVAIVVGGGLFGFPGMVLGVPTFAVLYALVREWVNHRLDAKGIDGNGTPRTKPAEPTEEE